MRNIRRKREEESFFLFRNCKDDIKKEEIFEIPGKVVHIDGDDEYLNKCMEVYKQLNVPAVGFNVNENEQPRNVLKILKEHNPEILVLTGHDALIKKRKDFKDINSYRNSKYFVESVKISRKFEPSRDELIIIAGACQSHYEELLNAGANFASSPKRIMIHAYDPVFIVEKLAYTPIRNTVNAEELLENTITGSDGVGGIETRGSYRIGFPKSPY
jgi:spore coat assembly protein